MSWRDTWMYVQTPQLYVQIVLNALICSLATELASTLARIKESQEERRNIDDSAALAVLGKVRTLSFLSFSVNNHSPFSVTL